MAIATTGGLYDGVQAGLCTDDTIEGNIDTGLDKLRAYAKH